jgi:hypothetical protein
MSPHNYADCVGNYCVAVLSCEIVTACWRFPATPMKTLPHWWNSTGSRLGFGADAGETHLKLWFPLNVVNHMRNFDGPSKTF